jgi:hypothetical protein
VRNIYSLKLKEEDTEKATEEKRPGFRGFLRTGFVAKN